MLWPYFDFGDSRWQFGSRFIALRHRPDRGPTKIGLRRHVPGWVAYLCAGTLFVKRFASDDEAAYADGTVFQTFSNEDMVEMEVRPAGAVSCLLVLMRRHRRLAPL